MAQDERSGGEGPAVLDWHRAFCKVQRGRLVHRLERMEQRIVAARRERLEDWDGENFLRGGGKKPGLEFYDRRPW